MPTCQFTPANICLPWFAFQRELRPSHAVFHPKILIQTPSFPRGRQFLAAVRYPASTSGLTLCSFGFSSSSMPWDKCQCGLPLSGLFVKHIDISGTANRPLGAKGAGVLQHPLEFAMPPPQKNDLKMCQNGSYFVSLTSSIPAATLLVGGDLYIFILFYLILLYLFIIIILLFFFFFAHQLRSSTPAWRRGPFSPYFFYLSTQEHGPQMVKPCNLKIAVSR